MTPLRIHAAIDSFLYLATSEYKIISIQLSIIHCRDEVKSVFSKYVDLTVNNGTNIDLSIQQYIDCLSAIESAHQLFTENDLYILNVFFEISKWKIKDQLHDTKSELIIWHTPFPCLTTEFQFEKLDHYYYIKQILEDLKICKLNEKHLKGK